MTAAEGHSALWDTLMFLRDMPQLLDEAPAHLEEWMQDQRLHEKPRGCVCCGLPASVSFVVNFARPIESGEDFRWLDTCPPCAFRIKSLER